MVIPVVTVAVVTVVSIVVRIVVVVLVVGIVMLVVVTVVVTMMVVLRVVVVVVAVVHRQRCGNYSCENEKEKNAFHFSLMKIIFSCPLVQVEVNQVEERADELATRSDLRSS